MNRTTVIWAVLGLVCVVVSLLVPADWIIFRIACLLPLATLDLLLVAIGAFAFADMVRDYLDERRDRMEIKR